MTKAPDSRQANSSEALYLGTFDTRSERFL